MFSFTTENVRVFLFKKETQDIFSRKDLSITVFAISGKEINLILKSSYSKLLSIFSKKLKVSIIEGTQVNLYPFDYSKNDVLNPDFFVKATYDDKKIKFETTDWIKLLVFLVIAIIFGYLYSIEPSEIVTNQETNTKAANTIKEVYSVFMGIGIGLIFNDLILKLLIPAIFKSKHPTVLITNFSNIFENRGIKQGESRNRLSDPPTN